ncbi:MAG TPA: hypothetical protein VIU33_09540 [Nitrospiria bacterium]
MMMGSFLLAIRDLLLGILPRSLSGLLVRPADFVFIIHPRDRGDIFRKYPFIRIFPDSVVDRFSKFLWPVLGPELTGIKGKKEGQIRGRVIFPPMTAEQMFGDLRKARKRILQAVLLGEKLSPKVVGLGALSASVMRGEWKSLDKVKALITSGSIYTSVLLRQEAERLAELTGQDLKECSVAVVGAVGLVGSLVSKLVIGKAGKLLLIDRRMKALTEMGRELSSQSEVPVEISKNLMDLKNADVIIAATNAVWPVFKPEDIPPGCLIIDDSRPTSTPHDLMEKRPDVIVVEGGIGRLNGLKCSFDFGLTGQDHVFGCLGESILLTWADIYETQFLEGKTDLEMAGELERISREMKIELAPFQWQGTPISQEQLDRIRDIREKKRSEKAVPS